MGQSVWVSVGDPAGIGPEILVKALANTSGIPGSKNLAGEHPVLMVAAGEGLLRSVALLCGLVMEECPSCPDTWTIRKSGSGQGLEPGMTFSCAMPGKMDLDGLESLGIRPKTADVQAAWAMLEGHRKAEWGEVSAASALVACLSLHRAWQGATAGGVLATAPINKEAFKALGVPFPGHTEFLGALSGGKTGLTMFETGTLRIFFHSRHVSLKKACDLVTVEALGESILRCIQSLKEMGIAKPRLAVAGLNPHCGEHGLFGVEDDVAVRPAVEAARALGHEVSGPIGADSVFHQAKGGRFDAVLSLYHDQGHIAAKTLDFDRTISVTLGLDVLRTSVDHGTAFDIAGLGIANSTGMEEALQAAFRYLRTGKPASVSPGKA